MHSPPSVLAAPPGGLPEQVDMSIEDFDEMPGIVHLHQVSVR